MLFIEVRCSACRKLLCEVSKDFYGLCRLKCRHCKKLQTVSVASILKELSTENRTAIKSGTSGTIKPPS